MLAPIPRFVLPAYLTLAFGLNANAEELRCGYTVEETVWKFIPTSERHGSLQSASRREDKSYDTPLNLGKDYFFVVKGDHQVVFDYRARRIFRLNLSSRTYVDSFLNGFVAYYVQKLTYRRARGESLKAAKTSDAELDQAFRLEYEFGIEIPRDELFPESIFRIDPDWVQDGRLTDIGLTELRSRLPYAAPNRYLDDRRMSSVADLITVDLVVSYVEWKLGCCVVPDASCTKALPSTQGQNLEQ
jgi:hypothetical protein